MAKKVKAKGAKNKRKTKTEADQFSTGRWWVAFGCLLVAIVGSSFAVIDQATEVRSHYMRLGEVQRVHDALLEEQSRLNLERSSISSLQKVEEIALTQLDMHFPEEIEGVSP